MVQSVKIATRKSPLALWQSNFVRERLEAQHSGVEITLLSMLTTADKMLTTPLNKIGGKGLFVKELETALLEHRADMAVHSIKDMPALLPEGLTLAVICKREDPRDAFVSNHYSSLSDLPAGAIIGTSSLRRKTQLLAMRPDLLVKPLRGNVNTRLEKLDKEEFDAIVLAAAGLKRLDKEEQITSYFDLDEMVPAAGQGAIGIECRIEDKNTQALVHFLNDAETSYAILAERAINYRLGGSCQFPIAAHAVVKQDRLSLTAVVGDLCGERIIRTHKNGPLREALDIAEEALEDLIKQGALELLQKVMKAE